MPLKRILEVYNQEKERLLSLDDTAQPNTTLEYCRRINIILVRLKVFLGLLLRSSNIRNAFELYFPIKILSSELIDQTAAVVLSSEWNFSPFTYPVALPELPEFIFIGIPASECQNPLILPLAGHELGHVVWRRKGAKQEFDALIRTQVLALYRDNWERFCTLFSIDPSIGSDKLETNRLMTRLWGHSYRIAQRQLEEVFCDFLGLFVFGRSYLYSFRYLLAPSLGHTRAVEYPRLTDRARYLMFLFERLGQAQFGGYAEAFSEQDPTLSPNDQFILEMADKSTENLYKKLYDMVQKYRGNADCFTKGAAEEGDAYQYLSSLVPVTTTHSVAATVNAAWDRRLALEKWDILKEVANGAERRNDKLRVLRDLVLKSFEVYEFNKRIDGKRPHAT